MGTAPYYAYGAVGLTGETNSSLDSIKTESLHENDIAVAIEGDIIYFYRVDPSSGEEQNSPYIIKPINESGDKRWVLISQERYTTDIIQLAENYIQTGHIKALSNRVIRIESAEGDEITIDQNGIVQFPSYVRSSVQPVDSDNLTNKSYVDGEYNAKQSELETFVEDEVDSIKTDLQIYVDGEVVDKEEEIKDYIDGNIDTKQSELETYIDDKLDIKEAELKQYNDDEIDRVVSYVYPIMTVHINDFDWTSDGNSYYNDITHNKGFEQTVVKSWDDDGELVYPEKVESISENQIRVWMPIAKNINISIL